MERTRRIQSILDRQRTGLLGDAAALVLTIAYLSLVVDLSLVLVGAR